MTASLNRRDLNKERYWRAIIAKLNASGMTHGDFCEKQKHGLDSTNLSSWKKIIKKRDLEKRVTERNSNLSNRTLPSRNIFVPVLASSASLEFESSNSHVPEIPKFIEIFFAGGKYSLKVDINVDRETLRRLVSALIDISRHSITKSFLEITK